GEKYDSHDLDYLTLLANEAGVTLSNMSLYSKLERSYYETILALAQSIEAKDPYTRGHASRVEQYSIFLCKCLNADAKLTELVAKAAILHDVGKIAIPDAILCNPNPLSNEEFEVMKTHTVHARKILSDITSLPAEVTNIAVHHHERYDGKGYPDHLKGGQIPLGAQIISVADTYDAMTTDRPYRKGLSVEEAVRRLKEASGTQLSPYVVQKFIDNIDGIRDVNSLPHYFEED
ncbi:HD-GYP domain-containing protein, partial [bacterium]|nr:HD-GYP domain-containing protein [bacterium]